MRMKRMSFVPALVLLLTLHGTCEAQLRVRNSGGETIVMKYVPLSQFGQKMEEKQIGGNSTVTVALDGPDAYAVSYHILGEDNRPGFHAKAGRPVPLRKMAASGDTFDIRAAQAAAEIRGQTLYQVTSADLLDSSQNVVEVIKRPERASRFVQGIVNARWNTQYRAVNGSNVRATVDFKNLRYGQRGSFTDVLITEDDKTCYICARWSYGQYKGDVFFKVSKNDPNRLTGDYLKDGDGNRRLNWSGSR